MADFAQPLLLIALGFLFAWFALIRSVFRILESEHPDVYRELGNPGADKNYSKATVGGLFLSDWKARSQSFVESRTIWLNAPTYAVSPVATVGGALVGQWLSRRLFSRELSRTR